MSVSLLQLFESTLSNASVIIRNMETSELLAALQLCINLQTNITELLSIHMKQILTPTPSNSQTSVSVQPSIMQINHVNNPIKDVVSSVTSPIFSITPTISTSPNHLHQHSELAKVVSSLVNSLHINGISSSTSSAFGASLNSPKSQSSVVEGFSTISVREDAPTSVHSHQPITTGNFTSFNMADVMQKGKVNATDSHPSAVVTHLKVTDLDHGNSENMKNFFARRLRKRKREDDKRLPESSLEIEKDVSASTTHPHDDPSSSSMDLTLTSSSSSSEEKKTTSLWRVATILLGSHVETLAPLSNHIEKLTSAGLGRAPGHSTTENSGTLTFEFHWTKDHLQQYVIESYPSLRRRRRVNSFTFCVGDPGSSLIPLSDWSKVSELYKAFHLFYNSEEELSSTAILYIRPTEDMNSRDIPFPSTNKPLNNVKTTNPTSEITPVTPIISTANTQSQKTSVSKTSHSNTAFSSPNVNDSARCSSCAITFPDYISFVEHIQQVHVFGEIAREHRSITQAENYKRASSSSNNGILARQKCVTNSPIAVVSSSSHNPGVSATQISPQAQNGTSALLNVVNSGRSNVFVETGKAGRRSVTSQSPHLYKSSLSDKSVGSVTNNKSCSNVRSAVHTTAMQATSSSSPPNKISKDDGVIPTSINQSSSSSSTCTNENEESLRSGPSISVKSERVQVNTTNIKKSPNMKTGDTTVKNLPIILPSNLLAALGNFFTIHQGKCNLICTQCGSSFPSAYKYIQHFLHKSNGTAKKIAEDKRGGHLLRNCLESFLETHVAETEVILQEISGEEWRRLVYFECTQCLSWKVNPLEFESHLLRCSTDPLRFSDSNDVRLCPVCERAFSNLSNFSLHLRKDHQSFYCEKCGLIEKISSDFLQHCKDCTGVGDTVDEL